MKLYSSKKLTSVILTIVCLLSVAFSAASCSDESASTIATVAETTAASTTVEVTTEEPTTAEPTTEEPTTAEPTTKKPTEKPTEAPKGIEVTYVTSSVSPGEYASISIQGEPNTDYSISVTYKSGASTADGLYTKTSDSSGYVSWEWKVGARTSSGTYPIRISGGGQSITESFTVS